MKTLVKIDKNGTKYWSDSTCYKCGGKGYIHGYEYIQGGICFDCWGSGISHKPHIEKEYTPEYANKLEEKRKVKEEKRIQEEIAKSGVKNQEFFKAQGFNENGFTYVVLGNTFDIKEELKGIGAKWSNLIGWHLPFKPEKYPSVEIHVDEVYEKNYANAYHWAQWKSNEKETYSIKIKEAQDLLTRSTSPQEFIGEVGDKVTLKLELVEKFSYDYAVTAWRTETKYIYKFLDNKGNILIWKTTNYYEKDSYEVTGTVKEHTTYSTDKQTVLTRCKLKKLCPQ